MAETHATRIARGSAYLVAQNIITAIVTALALIFIARILSEEEMGVIVALSLTLGMAQLLSDLGFSSGLTKYIAEYRGRAIDNSPLLFVGIMVKVSLAGFLAFFCVAASPQLSQQLLGSGEYSILFQLLSVDIMLFCINATVNGLLLGLDKVQEIAILNVLMTSTRQIVAVTLLMFGYGLIGLITGWILGDLFYLIPGISITLKGKHLRRHLIKETLHYLKMLFKFSWPLFLMNLVVFVYTWFDRVILLAYSSLSDVGVYNIVLRAFTVLSLIPGALSNTLFPYFSEQYGKNRQENIEIGVGAAIRYITLLFTPLALGLMVTANPVIIFFAGPAYARGDVTLSILSFFGAISGITAALGVLLLVFNMTSTVLLINVASVGVCLAISPLLLPSLGAVGMGIIRGVSMVVSFFLTFATLRKHVQIRFDIDAIWKGWSAASLMVVVVALIEQLHSSSYLLPVYILVGGIVYMIGLKALKAVNKDDIQLIRDLLGTRGSLITRILEGIFT